MQEWSTDLDVAPEASLARLRAAINLPRKRLFGLLKTRPEFLGWVDGSEFEIWERQDRAVHAFGEIRPRRGGGTVRLRFALPLRTKILVALFFVLYGAAGLEVGNRGEVWPSAATVLLVAVGALVIAAIFTIAARHQRDQLRAFVERVLTEERP